MLHLSILFILFASVKPDCCFTGTPTFQSPFNFQYAVSLGSSQAASKGNKYSVTVKFPSDYVITQENPTSCQNSANTLTCSQTQSIFNISWHLNTPSNSNGEPQIDVSAFGESCQKAQYCPLIDQIQNPSAGGSKSGDVNLGPLGSYPPSQFWPVMIAIIITFAGVGFLAYKRNSRTPANSTNAEADETAMTMSQNKSGWYGEKKRGEDLEKGNADGYTGFAAKKLKEKTEKDKNSTTALKNEPQRTNSRHDSKRDSWMPSQKQTLFDKIEEAEEANKLERTPTITKGPTSTITRSVSQKKTSSSLPRTSEKKKTGSMRKKSKKEIFSDSSDSDEEILAKKIVTKKRDSQKESSGEDSVKEAPSKPKRSSKPKSKENDKRKDSSSSSSDSIDPSRIVKRVPVEDYVNQTSPSKSKSKGSKKRSSKK